jgi:hypothetical protein
MRAPILLCPLWLACLPATAAELPALPEPERVVAERLAARHVPGEMQWLAAEGRAFLALYLPAQTDAPRGAVILLHGWGGHPDWPDVVAPLRRGLPRLGWATLSVQLPRLSPEVSHAAEAEMVRRAGPRLHAAAAWLADRDSAPVAVAGYGLGAAIAARQLAAPVRGVTALVAVSLQAPMHLAAAVGYPEALESVRVPVLDVFAAADAAPVLAQAPERELWGRKNKVRTFDRIVIDDAGPAFHGREEDLAQHIAAWLDANATRGQ